MFKGLSQELVDMESFWKHSISCGIAARVMASMRREQNIERFFTLGLLHDIGKLIIYSSIPKQAETVLTMEREQKGVAAVGNFIREVHEAGSP